MILPLVIFCSHFFYFAPLPEIYPYFDVLLQCSSLLVFPAYHIYFRLLTVDDKFSIKAHYKFFMPSIFLSIMYSLGVLITPKEEFRTWLFDGQAYTDSPQIYFLNILRSVIRVTYLVQVVLSVIGNSLFIRKYGSNAEQYYSDEEDGKYNNAKMLNYSIIIMGVGAFALTALGRHFLLSKDMTICLGWSVFTIMLFVIGYMGIRQKPINPTFEIENVNIHTTAVDLTNTAQKKIHHKLIVEFEQKKIYLNSQLNISDVVQAVGTNRTYISSIINLQYNQNFCSFVNNYRLDELKRTYLENPNLSNEVLAEKCGFGSINSMKRAIASRTGCTVSEWKSQLLKGNLSVC
jgi:AraC-like DNA-binding protein